MDQLSTGIKLKGNINCHLPHQRERKYCDKYCESLRSPTSLHYSQGTDRNNGRHLCERKRAHVEHCDIENSRKNSVHQMFVDQQSLNNLQTSDKKKRIKPSTSIKMKKCQNLQLFRVRLASKESKPYNL